MSNSSSVSIQSAIEAHSNGDIDACQRICEQLLTQNPSDPDALHIFGMALYAKKQFAEAQALLERAVALTPEVALLHANLATVLNDAGDLTRAKHHYQQALQILAPTFQPNAIEQNPAPENLYSKLDALSIITEKGKTLWKKYAQDQDRATCQAAHQTSLQASVY